ncbi:transposase [Candidatus Kaiserbacteria bacterium]|nr:transposase [Candidatus Kaiserbacteria bacterium]
MELYHVMNRGVDQRDIMRDDRDRARFVHDLFEFNDQSPAGSTYYSFAHKTHGHENLDLRNPDLGIRSRIVDIHGWCLMKNHYHLLLSERVEGGMTLFLRKLNVGYANYFNERYHRSGALFQGRTKKVLIERDAHFLYILHYIHLNPLDYLKGASAWRERDRNGIRNARAALAYLSEYRWSSYLDYCKTVNFPSILTTDFFRRSLGEYKKEIASYLKNLELEPIAKLTLE